MSTTNSITFLNTVKKSPILQLLILSLTIIVTRLLFRSKVLFNWDSINFALGTYSFDVVKHRPHPPGYILYIYIGKVFNLITGDPNTSFVIISILACVLLLFPTYYLGKSLFGEKDAFLALLILIFNPLIWFYSEVALTYELDVFFTTAIAYACFMILTSSWKWGYLGVVLLGIAGGFRQTTLIFMLPLLIYAVLHLPIKHIFGCGLALMVVCIGWGLPLLYQTGGIEVYLTITRLISSIIEPTSFPEIFNAIFLGANLILLLLLGYWLGLYKLKPETRFKYERWFIFLWVFPSLFVTIFMHYGQPGYVIYLMPVLAIYAPALIRGFIGWLSSVWSKAGTDTENNQHQKLLLTVLLFILIGILLSYSGLKRIKINDQYWGEVQEFNQEFAVDETMVLTNVLDFRQHSYYLPDYHVYGWIIPELSGPFKIDGVPQIPSGWVYHAYQWEDNYDLDPETHPLQTTLAIPSKITGLILTDYMLASSLRYSASNQSVHLYPISENYWNLNYVRLPEGVSEIKLINGELIIQ